MTNMEDETIKLCIAIIFADNSWYIFIAGDQLRPWLTKKAITLGIRTKRGVREKICSMEIKTVRENYHEPMDKLARTLRLQCQMSNTDFSLVHPDKVFANTPPLPHPLPQPISPLSSQTLSTVFQWREAKGFERSRFVLNRLQTALRSVHKHKVIWPADESALFNLPPDEYLGALLQPTADLFNQLRSLKVMTKPVECINIELGEFVYGATFLLEANPRIWTGASPIVLRLNEDLIDSNGNIGSRVEYAISKAVEYSPSVASIIVTNFSQIVVFGLPNRRRNRLDPTFERISTDRPSLALRVLSAAYLYLVALSGSLINMPSPTVDVDERLVLPQGPPNNPIAPLSSDEELFATHYRHSDFDLTTLVRDRDRTLQFFRWKEHVQRSCLKLVVNINDTLTGATNHLGNIAISEDSRPIYPYDPSEIPADTAEHIKSIQRESPLVSCGVADSFHKSKSFTLEIQNAIAEGSKRGICSVYRCRLTSIDNEPMSNSSPSLCLKLFDDRFQVLEIPDPEEEVRYKTLHWWFNGIAIAEEYALTEYYAYEKLQPVQGSVVPWFFGMHQFTLPNGMMLYGLLMEFIDGNALTPELVCNMSVDRQIKLIKSCRHASRVLDVADIAQRDWHPGQMLINTIPQTDIEYVILIDFGLTAQTWYVDEPNLLMNYHGALHVFSSAHGDNWEFVWKHYGEPDDWDPIYAFRPKSTGELVTLNARDMFSYISSA